MLRYFKLYGKFITNCIQRDMESRGNFIAGLLVIFCFPLFPLVFINAIYGQVTTLGGFSFYQYLLLIGTFEVISAITLTIALGNMFQLPEYVRKGELDFFLLKPVNSQFIITTRYVNFTEMARILPGIAMIIIGALNLNQPVDWWRWLLYPVFVLSGILIGYSLWLILITPSIWWVRMESFEVFFGVFELGRYHPNMFKGLVRSILVFVVPVGIIAATPTDTILQTLTLESALYALGVTGLLMLIANRFFSFALKSYNGASA